MNENVTNKTPKRRRWIARLLVSALCILLASSLLFVGVVAENIELVAQFSSSKAISSDAFNGVIPLNGTDLLYWNGSVIFISSTFGNSSFFYPYENYNRLSCAVEGSFLYVASCDDEARVRITCYDISDIFSFIEVYSEVVVSRYTGRWESIPGCGPIIAVEDGNVYGVVGYWSDSDNYLAPFVLYSNGDEIAFPLFSYSFVDGTNSAQVIKSNCLFYDGCLYIPCLGLCYNFVSGSRLPVSDSYTSLVTVFRYENNVYALSSSSIFLLDPNTRRFESVGSYSGYTTSAYANDGILTAYGSASNGSVPYTVYTGLPTPEPPPESSDDSSDETTTESPPESSEESSAGGVIDLYSYDKLSDGTYESAFIGTLDLTDATGLRVFLGMYLLGDNVWSDIKTPLTLLVYREDGSLDTYTYDYYAAGFAWGDGSPGSFTFPKFIGGYFDIPLTSSSELYFASSAPGGTIWLQNNSVVLRQINLLNSDSYVELENVSAEECIISVYDSPSDDDPESFVYTSGVLKYTLRKRSFSSSIPVSLEYGETGIVHGVMKYNGADFTVSSIILASDPDLMPPIYDFESMDNALSEAYDDVSRQQYLENLLTSYIENAYGTVSYDPDTSGAFLGGVDLMGDIVDSSGGSTIISAFVDMWSIHPFFPAMVGLLGTFLIFSFFLRKA